jgi:hypothetical protein
MLMKKSKSGDFGSNKVGSVAVVLPVLLVKLQHVAASPTDG